MKPFDLEAAKRGEPVQFLDKSDWCDGYFVGIEREGMVAIQVTNGYILRSPVANTRMAPKQTALVIEIWRDLKGRYWFTAIDQYGANHGASPYSDSEKIATLSYMVCE